LILEKWYLGMVWYKTTEERGGEEEGMVTIRALLEKKVPHKTI